MSLRLVSSGGAVIAGEVVTATSVRARVRGLIGRDRLEPGQGLHLAPCKQVHTFGMRFPIDVVFCDGSLTVVAVVRAMKPRRVSRVVLKAASAFELAAGAAIDIAPGDRLKLEGG